MAALVDPATARSSYDIAKDFLPVLAGGGVLAALIAVFSAQIVVWRQNNAAKKAADEKLAAEKRKEDRLDRQKQLAFLVMFYQELEYLQLMIGERVLLLNYFKEMADTAERQVLNMTDDLHMRVRLEMLCNLIDLLSIVRNDWQDLAILQPSLQITYHRIFNDLHCAEKAAEKARMAVEKSGMINSSEIEHIIALLEGASNTLNDVLPGLNEKLKSQIRESALDYHRPVTQPKADCANVLV